VGFAARLCRLAQPRNPPCPFGYKQSIEPLDGIFPSTLITPPNKNQAGSILILSQPVLYSLTVSSV